MVIGAKIFITEETEIIGTDERVRTKLYLYSLCRARRRKTIVKFDSHGDWREDIFYNGRNGNDRAARAEPSWLEFCRDVKEEDESQINRKTEKMSVI